MKTGDMERKMRVIRASANRASGCELADQGHHGMPRPRLVRMFHVRMNEDRNERRQE
jgi:hypothetical protein